MGLSINKRGRVVHRSGFLYEPHLFGHDVLFPAPHHASPANSKKLAKSEAGIKKDAAVVNVSSPELVLPGKFRIMK